LKAHFYLVVIPGFRGGTEVESRRIRGPKEEAMRRNRGEKDIRPSILWSPSQLVPKPVTYLSGLVSVDSKFVSAKGVRTGFPGV